MERLKENAISSALSYLREAEDNFSINSIVNIQKAYNEIVAFNDEPINVSYQGAKKNLYDLIKTKSNEFHERININTSINNKLITLLNENNVISFEVTDNIEKNKLSSVPIMLNFDASEQKLITDENGIATYRIPRIIDPKTINIFFKLDLETLINKISSESGPFFDHSKEFSTSFEFKKARAIIRSEEKNLNKLLKNKIIEPTIKSVLSNNIDFVVENADILILIRSNTMKKAERLGENYPYFAYGNISISIQNLADGNLFFNTSHSNIKGADFSALEIAGIRSYDALSEIIVNELKNQLIYGNE
jgi:hypothetical protein